MTTDGRDSPIADARRRALDFLLEDGSPDPHGLISDEETELAQLVLRLAERLERIDLVLTKPSGVITNDWYYRVQFEALQIARGE